MDRLRHHRSRTAAACRTREHVSRTGAKSKRRRRRLAGCAPGRACFLARSGTRSRAGPGFGARGGAGSRAELCRHPSHPEVNSGDWFNGARQFRGETAGRQGACRHRRAARIGVAALASSYRALFGHTARGAVAPYETEYGNEALFQQPQELGDLMGFYCAFGLTVKFAEHERADHISCECEFLSFLAMKEAYALEHGDSAMLAETRKAEKLFLRDHLGRFLPTFAQQLSREDPAGFYAHLADLCLRFVSQETDRLAIRLRAVNLPLRPADDDRVPMACGSGTECTAMPGACVPEGADSV